MYTSIFHVPQLVQDGEQPLPTLPCRLMGPRPLRFLTPQLHVAELPRHAEACTLHCLSLLSPPWASHHKSRARSSTLRALSIGRGDLEVSVGTVLLFR